MITTIHSLPPELLRLVIAAAYPAVTPTYPYKIDRRTRERNEGLRATALVCSGWTRISQEVLWEDVRLYSGQKMEAFAGALKLAVRSLCLVTFNETDPSQTSTRLERILHRTSGVEHLVVHDYGHERMCPMYMRLEDISGSSFHDLKVLDLHRIELPAHPEPIPLPFSLREIKIYAGEDETERNGSHAMLCQPSVTALELDGEGESHSNLLHDFFPIAHQLVTLSITLPLEPESFAPKFLEACVSLRHLTIDSLIPSWMKSIPVPLVSLEFIEFNDFDASCLVDLLEEGAVGVSKLQRLAIQEEDKSKTRASEGIRSWKKMVKMCRERGIKMVDGAYAESLKTRHALT